MKKNYLLLNFIVLLFSMTFGGYALQPTAAGVYTPTVTDDEVSVFLETSYTDNIKVYAWITDTNKFTGNWPGDLMTFMGTTADGTKKIYKWTYTGDKKDVPTGVIFTENGKKIGGDDDKVFVNHGYYVDGIYSKTIKDLDIYLLTAQTLNGTLGNYASDKTKWEEAHKMIRVDNSTVYKCEINSCDEPSFSFRLGVKDWETTGEKNNQMQPQTNNTQLEINEVGSSEKYDNAIEYFGNKYGQKDKAWKVNFDNTVYSKLTVYVDVVESADRKVWVEGTKSNVSQKTFTLLNNGATVESNTTGSFAMDLTNATADAAITLTIDDTTYGLAEVQTIKAVGTYNVDFTANEDAALTLAKGFIYSLSVKEDGKMTVVAKEKGVANGNYYLVGNFFNGETEINYDKKYFRFTDNGDGTLYFDIPATLSVNAQVLASDGTCYGPVDGGSGYGISNTHPSADKEFVDGNLVAGKNYWKFADRLLTGDGIYKVTIKVDETGVPTSWKIDFDKTQRMAYFLEDPEETTDAVAHPCYAKKDDDGYCDNKFFGNVYLEANQHCYVIGNIRVDWENNGVVNLLKTNPKLYLQGNGGRDVTTNSGGTSDGWKYTNVFPKQKGFFFPKDQSLYLEYNPSAGHQTENGVTIAVDGIAGEVKPTNDNFKTPITSIQIVGDGVVDSWDLGKAKEMKYNKTLDCWECTITTTKSESADNKFRFIANNSWEYNWGEESTKPEDQARTPHDLVDDEHLGHEASITDSNNLSLTTDGSEANRNGSGTFGDIIFNRPAGEWTIRFYSRAVSNGNDYIKAYGYTITGREHTGIPLTYRAGKFIRTYSNNVAMDIIDPRVKVYEAYKYTMPKQVEDIYSQGTLELRQLKYIPANMGVVLIGTVPASSTEVYTDGAKLNFSISKRTETSAEKDEDYVKVWSKADDYKNQPWNNFLVPTVEAKNDLGNADVDDKGIAHRYFGLGNYHRTNYYKETQTGDDYIGFFRFVENGVSGANKAYLSLPAREDVKGADFGCIKYNGQLIGTGETALAKMMLVFDDETSGVTEIKNVEVNKQNNDNAYYTLQGIKVLKPTKGIFIHNGKKIVIK